MVGEEVEIESYRISVDGELDVRDEKALEERLNALVSLIGPKAPPRIGQVWTGKVYLKLNDAQGERNRYGIAAFGHSFEEQKSDADGR